MAQTEPVVVTDPSPVEGAGARPEGGAAPDPIASQPPNDRAFILQHIYAEQIRLLYRFSLVGYLAEFVVTFILGAVLWEEMARPILFLWFIAAFVVMLVRYGLYKWFVHVQPAPLEFPAWEQRFVIGSVSMALLWAFMGTLLLPVPHIVQYPVIMCIALLTTGSVAYYSPHRSLFGMTCALSLIPMSAVLALWGGGGRTPALLGGALLVLELVLVMVHAKAHKALLDSLTARFDNVLMGLRLK